MAVVAFHLVSGRGLSTSRMTRDLQDPFAVVIDERATSGLPPTLGWFSSTRQARRCYCFQNVAQHLAGCGRRLSPTLTDQQSDKTRQMVNSHVAYLR